MSLVQRRLPEIPIERIAAWLPFKRMLKCTAINASRPKFRRRRSMRCGSQLPLWLANGGKYPADQAQRRCATQRQSAVSPECGFAMRSWRTRCECGYAVAHGCPLRYSTMDSGRGFGSSGRIDLARVLHAAPDMIQMQEQVQLQAGNASLTVSQRKHTPAGIVSTVPPTSHYRLQLGGLQASVQGTNMRWDQALDASVDVSANPQANRALRPTALRSFARSKARAIYKLGNWRASSIWPRCSNAFRNGSRCRSTA